MVLVIFLSGDLCDFLHVSKAEAATDITSPFSPELGLKRNFVLYLRGCFSELSSKADEGNGCMLGNFDLGNQDRK